MTLRVKSYKSGPAPVVSRRFYSAQIVQEFERNKVANVVGVGQCSDTGAAILLFGVGLSRVSPPTRDKALALLLKKFQTRN